MKKTLKLQSQYVLAQYVNYARKLFGELPLEDENNNDRERPSGETPGLSQLGRRACEPRTDLWNEI